MLTLWAMKRHVVIVSSPAVRLSIALANAQQSICLLQHPVCCEFSAPNLLNDYCNLAALPLCACVQVEAFLRGPESTLTMTGYSGIGEARKAAQALLPPKRAV